VAVNPMVAVCILCSSIWVKALCSQSMPSSVMSKLECSISDDSNTDGVRALRRPPDCKSDSAGAVVR
jgi:hypothetical protein